MMPMNFSPELISPSVKQRVPARRALRRHSHAASSGGFSLSISRDLQCQCGQDGIFGWEILQGDGEYLALRGLFKLSIPSIAAGGSKAKPSRLRSVQPGWSQLGQLLLRAWLQGPLT